MYLIPTCVGLTGWVGLGCGVFFCASLVGRRGGSIDKGPSLRQDKMRDM